MGQFRENPGKGEARYGKGGVERGRYRRSSLVSLLSWIPVVELNLFLVFNIIYVEFSII